MTARTTTSSSRTLRVGSVLRTGAGWVIAALSGAVLTGYLALALHSLAHPFALEWMEGGSVDVVARILRGEPLYVAPSVDYVPYLYAPGYYFTAAAFARVLGVGYLAARLVSFLATLVSAALLYALVLRESRRPHWGAAAAAFYLASYTACGNWFHLARVDSLYVALLLGTIACVRWGGSMRSDLGCGALAAAAVLTKQSGLLALLPLFVWLGVVDRRRGARVAGVAAASLVSVSGLWQWTSQGWFLYYVWEVPGKHPLIPDLMRFWTEDLKPAWPLLAVALGGLLRARDVPARERGFRAAVLTGCLASAWAARSHSGGAENTLMPAFAVLALLGALSLAEWAARLRSNPGLARALVAPLFAVAQLALLALPLPVWPSLDGERARGARFLDYVRSRPGEVLIPDQRFVAAQAGKHSYGLEMAAADLLRIDDADRGKQLLRQSITSAFARHRFSTVILSVDREFIPDVTRRYYCFSRAIDFAPRPITGARHRPRWVFVRPDDPGCVAR